MLFLFWVILFRHDSLTIISKSSILFLGDLFDEGQWVDEKQFQDYARRYHRLFYTDDKIQVFGALGNHDIGFHYRYVSIMP